jgi:hypothetical protein
MVSNDPFQSHSRFSREFQYLRYPPPAFLFIKELQGLREKESKKSGIGGSHDRK